jgi:hypothetical protein
LPRLRIHIFDHVVVVQKQDEGLEGTFIHSMFERAAMDVDLIDIKQWVAMPASALPPLRRTPR